MSTWRGQIRWPRSPKILPAFPWTWKVWPYGSREVTLIWRTTTTPSRRRNVRKVSCLMFLPIIVYQYLMPARWRKIRIQDGGTWRFCIRFRWWCIVMFLPLPWRWQISWRLHSRFWWRAIILNPLFTRWGHIMVTFPQQPWRWHIGVISARIWSLLFRFRWRCVILNPLLTRWRHIRIWVIIIQAFRREWRPTAPILWYGIIRMSSPQVFKPHHPFNLNVFNNLWLLFIYIKQQKNVQQYNSTLNPKKKKLYNRKN